MQQTLILSCCLSAILLALVPSMTSSFVVLAPQRSMVSTSNSQLSAIYTPGRSSSKSRKGDERSKRQFRVGELVRTELAKILHTGNIKGDASHLEEELRQRISIVGVDVSPDLRQARISVSVRNAFAKRDDEDEEHDESDKDDEECEGDDGADEEESDEDPGDSHPGERRLWAAQHNHLEIVTQLLDRDQDLVKYKDTDEYTALHRAAYSHHPDMLGQHYYYLQTGLDIDISDFSDKIRDAHEIFSKLKHESYRFYL